MVWYEHALVIAGISAAFNFIEWWVYQKPFKRSKAFELTMFSAVVWLVIWSVWHSGMGR